MTELSLVDIFFVITGAAVVIITILLAIGLLYVIVFVRTIKNVARTAQRATELVSEDLSELRTNIKEKGVNFGAISSFAKGLARRKVSPRSKK